MAQVKKAEKSRVHAKQRRTDESKEICEIADLLPLPRNVTKRLDKASILRLAITFLKLRNYIGSGEKLVHPVSILLEILPVLLYLSCFHFSGKYK